MEKTLLRPFYYEYAWAYDLLISAPVASQCNFIVEPLATGGASHGARILDAGCGTGNYAVELARRGFAVTGIDQSVPLLAVAREKAGGLPSVSFVEGDFLNREAIPPYAGVLCRGVLNDFLDDSDREAAFTAFAKTLRPSGMLFLDVREWHATQRRKAGVPTFEKTVETPKGTLTFRSHTRLEPRGHRVLIEERHTLRRGDHETVSDCSFAMRCWTKEEVQACLSRSGFVALEWLGAYDRAIPLGATDRLIVVALRM